MTGNIFQYNLLRIRTLSGLSGYTLAVKLGITPNSYYRMERGSQKISFDMLDRLVEAFQVPVSEFFIPIPSESIPNGFADAEQAAKID